MRRPPFGGRLFGDLLVFFITVFQPDGKPECIFAAAVFAEIPGSDELERVSRFRVGKGFFSLAVFKHSQRIRVQIIVDVDTLFSGILDVEQIVVKVDRHVFAFGGGDPMDRSFDLPSVRGHSASRFEICLTAQLFYAPVAGFDDLFQFDYISPHQANFPVRFKTEEFRRRHFREIVGVNIKFPRKSDFSFSRLVVFRNVRKFKIFFSVLGIILDNDLDRMKDDNSSLRRLVQFLAYTVFEKRAVNKLDRFRNARSCDEIEDRGRRVTSSSHTADGRHSRIVPAVHRSVFDEFAQKAF